MPYKKSSRRLPRDVDRLTKLALALSESGSRSEDRFWEQQLEHLLSQCMRLNHQSIVDEALNYLQQHNFYAYSILAECAESVSETALFIENNASYEALLIAIPMLVWTRYTLPGGALPQEKIAYLQSLFATHISAQTAKIQLLPTLYSIDELPHEHVQIFKLTHQLAQATLSKKRHRPRRRLASASKLLADPRFLLAVSVTLAGEAHFRWQHLDQMYSIERQQCLDHWATATQADLKAVFSGCEFKCLLPDAYHTACRNADTQIRPYIVRAAIRYLEDTLGLNVSELQIVIGGFGETQINEYRISFTEKGMNEVLYGVVWPLYGSDSIALDERAETVTEIAACVESPLETIVNLLKDAGISDIRRYAQRFDPEYCEECSAPLYSNLHGELVHAIALTLSAQHLH